MNPKFSVIVPVYNTEAYFRKCIDSILNQTFEDFELILVDDGSTDGCPVLCDAFADADRRVRVIHKKHSGLVAARNTGIFEAKGDYICYVDSDDWVSEVLLETVWKKALSEFDVDVVVFSAMKEYDDREEPIPEFVAEGLYTKDKLRELVYPYLLYDPRRPFYSGIVFSAAWNKIYKREFLLKHYCREERIGMGEDSAFVYECIYEADSVYSCEDRLYYYNQMNAGSMIRSYDPDGFRNTELLTKYVESRLSGRDKAIDVQINVYKTFCFIVAVVNEVKDGRSIATASKRVKEQIKQTSVLQSIRMKGLPLFIKLYVLLLNLHMYRLAVLGAALVSKK